MSMAHFFKIKSKFHIGNLYYRDFALQKNHQNSTLHHTPKSEEFITVPTDMSLVRKWLTVGTG